MYYAIDDFRFGLDRRKFMLNAPPGTLYDLVNGHITSGGEIEKRKAFTRSVWFTSGTPDTFGLEVVSSGFVTFGSKAEGDLNDSIPPSVTYQRLQHPNGGSEMVGVIHSTVYNSAAFVIADFGADGIISFYDGEVVDDLSPGKLATILADADALAAYMAGLIDALEDYEANASNGTVTIEGPEGQTFSVAASNDSTCTEPLDTDPPDVTGVSITACTILIEADPGYTTLVTQVLMYYNPGAVGLADDSLEGWDGVLLDVKAYADAALVTMLGGDEVQVRFQPGGGDTITGTVTINVTYSNGATKEETLPFNVTDPAAQEIDFTLDADPLETNPTIDADVISDGSQSSSGTVPQGQLTVIAVKDGGTGKMTSITVDGTEILGTAATDLSGANYATVELLAEAIKDQINTYCAGNDVDILATRVNSTVIFRATDPATYSAWTGDAVVVTVDDDICIGNCGLTFSRASEANTPTWDAITVDGVDILGTPVAWNADMTTSIQDVAARIITNSGDYTAVAVGSTLYISKLATSSGDSPMQVVVSGTYLLYSSIGSTDGTQGGAFPGTIVVETANIPLRLQGNYPVTNSWVTASAMAVVATGGQPPYIYKWERSSGDATVPLTDGTNLGAPTITSPNSPRTNLQGPLKPQAKTFAAYRAGFRCQITDSMNRTGYSPEIIIHYP